MVRAMTTWLTHVTAVTEEYELGPMLKLAPLAWDKSEQHMLQSTSHKEGGGFLWIPRWDHREHGEFRLGSQIRITLEHAEHEEIPKYWDLLRNH
jgi:hypothetical protein